MRIGFSYFSMDVSERSLATYRETFAFASPIRMRARWIALAVEATGLRADSIKKFSLPITLTNPAYLILKKVGGAKKQVFLDVHD
jgi:hypothetical protein